MTDTTTGLEIAIIGMAGRFPGAPDVATFWRQLREGVESIRFFSVEELRDAGVARELLEHPDYVRAAPVIDGIESFAATFFGYTPREAELLDPQQRLFLECASEAFEDAGYDPRRAGGLVGVYAGSWLSKYLLFNLIANPAIDGSTSPVQLETSTDKDYLATRVSYNLGLGGPSLNVESACSTALVAVHLACQGLLSGECDVALAGAVHLQVPQLAGHLRQEGTHLSRDGHCRAFDAEASGTIFGSGLGAVVLKRLEDAERDGDAVRAVIKGSAVSNDGAAKVGFLAPGVDGQERVIKAAHVVADVDPETISYVEAHGTGTRIGDPIEVEALTRAFRARTAEKGFCALGSVKSNIGHLGSASGIASLIKTVLALEHGELPPSLHCETPNPDIDFASSPFFVQTELGPWPSTNQLRRAGVSAFGMGGTNAHLVLEEAPQRASSGPSRPGQLVLLSAKSPTALDAMSARLASHLEAHPELPLADVAYTLATGRQAMDHRRAVVCRDRDELIRALDGRDPGRALSGRLPSGRGGKGPAVAFLFSGQGAQYPGMAAELYEHEAVFRDTVDRAAEVLADELGTDLRRLIFTSEEGAAGRLAETRFTQPALFTIEVALARLWMSWGVEPEAMLGHSIGEYVAACLAEVFSFEDGLGLVAARGRLIQSLEPGAMLSVPLAEAAVEKLLGDGLSLAAVNAAERVVVSGTSPAIDKLAARLDERGVSCRRLHTSHAFHSAMMEPILEPFAERLRRVEPRPPKRRFLSNVTGTWIRADEAVDPAYWVNHLRGAVRFADGVGELLREPRRVLLEVGPGTTLATLARRHPERRAEQAVISCLPSPRETTAPLDTMLGALARLWLAGAPIDGPGFWREERRHRVSLPTYPFERRRYWLDPAPERPRASAEDATRKNPDLARWFYQPTFQPGLEPPPFTSREAKAEDRRWLIFRDAQGLGDELARQLVAAGREVVTVEPGAQFVETVTGRFTLRPGERDDYTALLDALAADGGVPRRVLHLWGLTEGGGEKPADEPAERALELGFYSLLALGQALAARLDETVEVEVRVVVNGVLAARRGDRLWPEKAAVVGPVRVLPQEHANLRCALIDVGPWSAETAPCAAERILAEATAASDATLVAWRDGERLVEDFRPQPIPEAIEERLPLRRGATVLITGGLGGLGLAVARFLAESYGARLALLGRSALPTPETWDDVLRDQGDGGLAERIRRVRELEALGAEVLTLAADVADEASMKAAFAELRRRFGRVDGVIHAAGVAGGGLIQRKTRDEAERVLAAKVRGSRVLLELLADDEPDFTALFSSTAAVLGTVGQVDYCAANNVLDAWAAAARTAGRGKVVAIAWGAWEEIGMAVDAALPLPRPPARTALPERVGSASTEEVHPLLGREVERTAERAVFSQIFSPASHWVLSEHRVLGVPTLSGTTYLEMARAACEALTGAPRAELREVLFLTPLQVPEGESREVRTVVETSGDGFALEVMSRAASVEPWVAHAQARVRPLAADELGVEALTLLDADAIRRRCDRLSLDADPLQGKDGPVEWGPRWRSLAGAWRRDGEGLVELALPAGFVVDDTDYGLHPALFDAAAAVTVHGESDPHLPLSYGKVRILEPLRGTINAHLRLSPTAGSETVSADLTFCDAGGRPLVVVEHFVQKRFAENTAARPAPAAASAKQPAGIGDRLLAGGGIAPVEGVEALRRILSRFSGPRIVVSCKDLAAQIELAGRSFSAEELLDEAAALVGAPRDSHPRPDLATAYVAPQSPTEERLAELWQDLLGLDRVGIHDNFYDLGGDSVIGLQIVARAKKAGLELSPSQLFEHLTVAELAAVVAPAAGESCATDPSATELPWTIDRAVVETWAEGRGELEDVYPLTPAQQGLLLHSLEELDSGLYLEVASSRHEGEEVDRELLARAWQAVISRHAVLRTAFLWQELDEPLQAVVAHAELPIVEDDLRHLDPRAQQEELARILRREGETPLAFDQAPLVRVRLARLGETSSQLIWTHHHLIMDGWSAALILQQVMDAYRALTSGGPVELGEEPRPFRDYVAWLRRQDHAAARRYWRERLQGVKPCGLVSGAAVEVSGERSYGEHQVVLDRENTAALNELARARRSTISAWAQGAWALLLTQENGVDDVVYGLTVAGRPAELSGVESMVGLFINTLPMRLETDPELDLTSFVDTVAEAQQGLLDHGHLPLAEVQRGAELGEGEALFSSLFLFWNFPGIPSQVVEDQFRYEVRTHYPLVILAIPNEALVLSFIYDRRRLDAARVARLGERFVDLLRAFVAQPSARLGDVRARLAAQERDEQEREARRLSDLARAKWKPRGGGRGKPAEEDSEKQLVRTTPGRNLES